MTLRSTHVPTPPRRRRISLGDYHRMVEAEAHGYWREHPRTAALPVRWIGGYLTFVAVGLTVAWMGMWFAYAFGGTVPPMGPEPFKLVAALDIGLMVPALAGGGTLLWLR